jgi:hypothetical protein
MVNRAVGLTANGLIGPVQQMGFLRYRRVLAGANGNPQAHEGKNKLYIQDAVAKLL